MKDFLIIFFCFYGAWAVLSIVLYRKLRKLILSLYDVIKLHIDEEVKVALYDYLGLNK